MKRIQFLWLLIAVLVLARVAYYYAQPDVSTDHLSQMAMAQNFMDGNGFSFKYFNAEGEIYYTTHIQWPPLYPFLIAMLGMITGNLLLSSFILQIFVLVLLVITWRKTFNFFSSLLTEETYFYFISFLLISTSILNNINTILVFAILLLSVSMYFTFAYLFKEKSKLNLTLSALFAALLFWTHYSYFFVAFYPALVLLIIYFLRKDRKYLFAGSGSFIISLVISSGVLIYNFVTTSNINYMDNPDIWDAGFFPEHLLLTDPFFINAFFKTSYLFDYILKAAPDLIITLAFQLVSLLVLAAIIILYSRLINNNTLPSEKISQLFVPFFVIVALIISFLLYFTLRYHEIPRPNWTHIGDPRYLSAVYMSVAAIVVMLIFNKAGYISNKFVKSIKLLMLFVIFINLLINIYITADHWGKYSFTKNVYEQPYNELGELYDNIKLEKSKGSVPVFIDNELTVRSVRISQYAGAAVIGSDELNEIEEIPANMTFFFILPIAEQYRDEDHLMLEWSEKFNLKNIGKVYNNLSLYKVNSL